MAIGMDHIMTFGKHEGHQVEDILEDDPSYMVWLAEETNTDLDEEVLEHISRI